MLVSDNVSLTIAAVIVFIGVVWYQMVFPPKTINFSVIIIILLVIFVGVALYLNFNNRKKKQQ
jgi:hypothetical protein